MRRRKRKRRRLTSVRRSCLEETVSLGKAAAVAIAPLLTAP